MAHEPLRALGAAATTVLRSIGIETTPGEPTAPADELHAPHASEPHCWFCGASAGPEVTLVTPGAQVVWHICQACTKDAVGSLVLAGALTVADLLNASRAVIQSVRVGTEEHARAKLSALDTIAAQCARDAEAFLVQARDEHGDPAPEPTRLAQRATSKRE